MMSDDDNEEHRKWLAQLMKEKLDSLKKKFAPRPELDMTLELYKSRPN